MTEAFDRDGRFLGHSKLTLGTDREVRNGIDSLNFFRVLDQLSPRKRNVVAKIRFTHNHPNRTGVNITDRFSVADIEILSIEDQLLGMEPRYSIPASP
jgi:hypothetical protein